MSNPTSNFNWQMPTNTDLVSQLPADFEVFGQAVDTSLADLKGGTTGQVLKKNSNTDMDFVWGTDSAGMTNPMTTTGDTIYSSSGSTPARLGIGSTGQVLTVSGGVPTWAAVSGGGYTLLASGSLSGTSLAVTGLSTAYRDLVFIMRDFYCNNDTGLYFRVNATSSIYYSARGSYENTDLPATSTYFEPTGSSVDSRDANNAFYWRIFDYANTSSMKMGEAFIANGRATGSNFNFIFSNSLINTTSAITQINLQNDGGATTFSGGTYEVYGVK
jgi:hypothetical protein